MAFLFNKKKSPVDLVKSTQKYLTEYHEDESDDKNMKKVRLMTTNLPQM